MSILHFSTQDIVYLRCPTQIHYAWMPLVLSIQIDKAILQCFHILTMSSPYKEFPFYKNVLRMMTINGHHHH